MDADGPERDASADTPAAGADGAEPLAGSFDAEGGDALGDGAHDADADAIAADADGIAAGAADGDGDANGDVGVDADVAAPAEDAEHEARFAVDVNDQHERHYIEQMERRKNMLRQQLLDKKKVPASYHTNSHKEQLILQYVENFNRQYCQLYPGRKELLLCPPNEFGIKPKALVSPTYTLRIQSGNCFDMSVLLSSLLRGVGYDAYVVSGYASRNITLMDQTRTSTEQPGIRLPGEDAAKHAQHTITLAQNSSDSSAPSKYRVKPPRQLKSSFLAKQEERRRQLAIKKDAEGEKINAEQTKPPALLEDDDDELKGLRVHAWVLVLPGKREVAEAFFIEPSTGKIYSTENENYLGLESVFSSQNYWVNMQVCFDGLKASRISRRCR
nr:hypothetical protein HK105_000709 [Polyrhizophydium stewartii]